MTPSLRVSLSIKMSPTKLKIMPLRASAYSGFTIDSVCNREADHIDCTNADSGAGG